MYVWLSPGDLAAASFKRQLSLMFAMPDCNLRSDFVAAFQYDFVSTITGACRVLALGVQREKTTCRFIIFMRVGTYIVLLNVYYRSA